jgi:hypothetical protein
VSYYNNFSKKAGKFVARALTVIIKTLEGIWNTMNISTTNEVRDKIGEKGNDFHVFSFEDILQYVNYELKTSIFKYGDKYISQKNGLPMGGFLSASLAQIDSMYKEHVNYKLWKHNDFPTKWIRFRDDGRGVIGKHLSDTDINDIQTMLGKIYGKNLNVIIEDWSYQEVTFLDARIIINPIKFKIELRHFNKNIDLRKDDPRTTIPKIIRFPDIQSGWCSYIFIGCMIGAVRRVQRTCNTNESFLLGVLELLWEWLNKDYAVTQIEKSFRRANTTCDDIAINLLREFKSRPNFPKCHVTTTIKL